MLDLSQTPNLESPDYTVLLVTKEYEVRRYEPFMVAEAPMGAGSSECTADFARYGMHSAVSRTVGSMFVWCAVQCDCAESIKMSSAN